MPKLIKHKRWALEWPGKRAQECMIRMEQRVTRPLCVTWIFDKRAIINYDRAVQISPVAEQDCKQNAARFRSK